MRLCFAECLHNCKILRWWSDRFQEPCQLQVHGKEHLLGLVRMPVMATGQRKQETYLFLLWLCHVVEERLYRR